MKVPEALETDRLVIRGPRADDAEEVFERYASDPEVTTYMSWPRHETLEVTKSVVEFWLDEWQQRDCGAFLITDRSSGAILGSTGFDLVKPGVATTGYVLARDEWGKGYATEALNAIVELSTQAGIQRLFAYCHFDHRNSARVMEKCGFEFEGRLRNYMEFPNLAPGVLTDVLLYAWIPPAN